MISNATVPNENMHKDVFRKHDFDERVAVFYQACVRCVEEELSNSNINFTRGGFRRTLWTSF